MAERTSLFLKRYLLRALGLEQPPPGRGDQTWVEGELSDYIIEVIRANAAEVEAILAATRKAR